MALNGRCERAVGPRAPRLTRPAADPLCPQGPERAEDARGAHGTRRSPRQPWAGSAPWRAAACARGDPSERRERKGGGKGRNSHFFLGNCCEKIPILAVASVCSFCYCTRGNADFELSVPEDVRREKRNQLCET